MRVSDERAAEIQERLHRASQGKWEARYLQTRGLQSYSIFTTNPGAASIQMRTGNANLCAHAPEDLHDLLADRAEAIERERWIPVSERLPKSESWNEEETLYLVWTPAGYDIAFFIDDEWVGNSRYSIITVTHWRKPPDEPPQQEQ